MTNSLVILDKVIALILVISITRLILTETIILDNKSTNVF